MKFVDSQRLTAGSPENGTIPGIGDEPNLESITFRFYVKLGERKVSRFDLLSQIYGWFLKWWYPQNTPKLSFLLGKPMFVGYHHFRKPPYWVWDFNGWWNHAQSVHCKNEATPNRCWLEKWYWTWRHHHSDQHHHYNHYHDNEYNHNHANKYRQGQRPANGGKNALNMNKKGSNHATFTISFESCNKKDEPLLHFGVFRKFPVLFLGVSSIMWNHEALMLWLAISKRIGAHGRPVATINGAGKKEAHLVAQRDLPAHMKVSVIPM